MNIKTEWNQPIDWVECWIESGKGKSSRLLMSLDHRVDMFSLPISNSFGKNIGYIVFKPYAEIRNRFVLEATELLHVSCQKPNLPDAWSGVLGLRLGDS